MGFDPGESRDEGGRWTSGGGAGRAAAKKARPAKLAQRAKDVAARGGVQAHASAGGYKPGRDISGELDYVAVNAARERERAPDLTDLRSRATDERFGQIAATQGFDGLPQVASREQVDKLVADGGVEMFRGYVNAGGLADPVGGSGEQFATQFREGPLYHGIGQSGSGTYTAEDSAFAGKYADPSRGGYLQRMVLRKDAKVITEEDLVAAFKKDYASRPTPQITAIGGSHVPTPEETAYQARLDVERDPGRYAAALGYDAIYVKPWMGRNDGQYVILNRTALTVQKEQQQR